MVPPIRSGCAPVFVVGSARSGTTLVYALLMSSGEFPVYEAETRLLDACPHHYGDLRGDADFERFLADWTNSKQFVRSGLDEASFRREAARHRGSYDDLLASFMGAVAAAQGLSRWAEQSPGNVHGMRAIAQAFPHARFLHVIRDGRDVALSRRQLGWVGTGRSDPVGQLVRAAFGWEHAVRAGRRSGRRLGDRYHEVRYETLVDDPAPTLDAIGRFVGAEITLDGARDVGSLRAANTAFAEPISGISGAAVGRWRDQLSDVERTALHRAIGATLDELGYAVDADESRRAMRSARLAHQFRWRAKRLLKARGRFAGHTRSPLELGTDW